MTARNAARVLCSELKGMRRPKCYGIFSELLAGSVIRTPTAFDGAGATWNGKCIPRSRQRAVRPGHWRARAPVSRSRQTNTLMSEI